MSEIIKNNSEQTPNSNSEKAEYPEFNAKAAEEARQQRIAEYKAKHPDAIDDVEKARFMAMVEDPYRTQAVANRKAASKHQKEAEELYIKKEQEAASNDWESSVKTGDKWISALGQRAKMKHEANIYDERAEKAGKDAGTFYDNLHNNQ